MVYVRPKRLKKKCKQYRMKSQKLKSELPIPSGRELPNPHLLSWGSTIFLLHHCVFKNKHYGFKNKHY